MQRRHQIEKLERTWNREPKEFYSSELNFKELKEIEKILQDEPSSLETLIEKNSRIVRFNKFAAARRRAFQEVKRGKRKGKQRMSSATSNFLP